MEAMLSPVWAMRASTLHEITASKRLALAPKAAIFGCGRKTRFFTRFEFGRVRTRPNRPGGVRSGRKRLKNCPPGSPQSKNRQWSGRRRPHASSPRHRDSSLLQQTHCSRPRQPALPRNPSLGQPLSLKGSPSKHATGPAAHRLVLRVWPPGPVPELPGGHDAARRDDGLVDRHARADRSVEPLRDRTVPGPLHDRISTTRTTGFGFIARPRAECAAASSV